MDGELCIEKALMKEKSFQHGVFCIKTTYGCQLQP
jgi:hypothetical protein